MLSFCSSFSYADATISLSAQSAFYLSAPVDELRIVLHAYPRNDRTTSSLLQTKGILYPEGITFRYHNVQQGSFWVNATIERTSSYAALTEEIPYPYVFDEQSLQTYLAPTTLIDSDHPAILAQAQALAQQNFFYHQNYYEAVFTIGAWVNEHINYSLTTLTANASEPASWVLQERYGVCDEITVLYLALLRASGIPARYVSGLTYVNGSFGSHGWAEVYFPNYGWVPFDITYGQYGFVDDTHVKLLTSHDVANVAVSYSWSAKHPVSIKTTGMQYTGTYVQTAPEYVPFQIFSSFLYPVVAPGSFNALRLEFFNPTLFFLGYQFSLTYPPEVVMDTSVVRLYLKPQERKVLYFPLKVLVPNITKSYKIPFLVAGQQTHFLVMPTAEHISYDELPLEAIEPFFASVLSAIGAPFFCSLNESFYYPDEHPVLLCRVQDPFYAWGSSSYGTLCLDTCVHFSSSGNYSFSLPLQTPGVKEKVVTLHGPNTTLMQVLHIPVRTPPSVRVEVPSTASLWYGNNLTIPFTLTHSGDDFFNATLLVMKDGLGVTIPFFSNSSSFTIPVVFPGEDFVYPTTTIFYRVAYYDGKGRPYTHEGTIAVTVHFSDSQEKVLSYFYRIIYWFEQNLLLTSLVLMLVVFVALVLELRIIPLEEVGEQLSEKENAVRKALHQQELQLNNQGNETTRTHPASKEGALNDPQKDAYASMPRHQPVQKVHQQKTPKEKQP
ncbi:MAG: transglutaminase-like domain-containing protein [Candidatus Woesearchaeota archaeon]